MARARDDLLPKAVLPLVILLCACCGAGQAAGAEGGAGDDPAGNTGLDIAPAAPSAEASPDSGIAPAEDAVPAVDEASRTSSRAVTWNGYFKNETAFRFEEPRSFTKLRNTLSITGNFTFSPRYSLTVTGQAFYDAIYDLADYDTIVARQTRNDDQPLAFLFNLGKEKDSFGAEFREFYLDIALDNTDIRAGRQFVVWGILEGVRIVDEINPLDFRELILPDLLDSRIPLWMLKIDHYRDEGTYQLLWIPDLLFHQPAPPGSEWELLQEVPGTVYPEESLENSEVAFRFSTNIWDTELTLSYFYTWDDFPVVFRNILIDQLQTEPEFNSTYTRISMYGTTLAKQIGSYILKGELVYVPDKYFAILDTDRDNDGVLDSQGEFQKEHIRWGFGLEFNWGGMDIAPGITQWIVLDWDPALIQDEYDTGFNLFLRKEYPQRSLLFEMLVIDFITLHELYINPEWTFSNTDRAQFSVGFDLFSGKKSQFGVLSNTLGQPTVIDQRSQFVGNFHDNSRIYVAFKYSF